MPREEEMLSKDKYTIFDKKEKNYRKGIHSMFYSHVLALFYLAFCAERDPYVPFGPSLKRTGRLADRNMPNTAVRFSFAHCY